MSLPQQRPEIIIAFVGAVGSNLQQAITLLKESLRTVNYSSHEIKLSQLLRDFSPQLEIPCPPKDNVFEEKRIDGLMDAGNEFRKKTGRADALSILAISAIHAYRKQKNVHIELEEDKSKTALGSQAYILHSLKHPKEVAKLRDVYGDNFIVISLFSPQKIREHRLLEKIKKSHHGIKETNDYRQAAQNLIKKDSKQEGLSYGQNVSDAFPLADFFIKEEVDEEKLAAQIRRFIKILFGYPFITPTVVEYCMFAANAAALRSADLSRQVGAVIATDDGEFIAAGCNEVPKAGGGAFWEGNESSSSDNRDYKKEFDTNAAFRDDNIIEVFRILKENKLLSAECMELSSEELANKSLSSNNPFLKSSGIANVIEYGRIVHAEMSAITEAARRGLSVNGATIYCTTFPCHMCARHILSAGISKVIYVEPYPKSLTKALYGNSVQIDDGKSADQNAVLFEPFVGIAPRIYFSFFKKLKRKEENGDIVKWHPENARPRFKSANNRYIVAEVAETVIFNEIIDRLVAPNN